MLKILILKRKHAQIKDLWFTNKIINFQFSVCSLNSFVIYFQLSTCVFICYETLVLEITKKKLSVLRPDLRFLKKCVFISACSKVQPVYHTLNIAQTGHSLWRYLTKKPLHILLATVSHSFSVNTTNLMKLLKALLNLIITMQNLKVLLRGLEINKSAPLSLNHHIFSKTEPIYTKKSFMESLLNHPAFENKNIMVD